MDPESSQLHPAGPAKRFLATLIDYPIGFMPTLAVGVLVRVWLWMRAAPGEEIGVNVSALWEVMGWPGQLVVYIALFLGGPWYYQAILESSPWQATLGKRWLGIHVADTRDGPLGFGSALGRAILKFALNALLLLFPLSLVTMLVNKDRRALHDFIARTKVFRGKPLADGSFGLWRLVLWPGLPVFAISSMAALYLL